MMMMEKDKRAAGSVASEVPETLKGSGLNDAASRAISAITAGDTKALVSSLKDFITLLNMED